MRLSIVTSDRRAIAICTGCRRPGRKDVQVKTAEGDAPGPVGFLPVTNVFANSSRAPAESPRGAKDLSRHVCMCGCVRAPWVCMCVHTCMAGGCLCICVYVCACVCAICVVCVCVRGVYMLVVCAYVCAWCVRAGVHV